MKTKQHYIIIITNGKEIRSIAYKRKDYTKLGKIIANYKVINDNVYNIPLPVNYIFKQNKLQYAFDSFDLFTK